MVSSLSLKHQTFSPSLKHQASSPSLKYQASSSSLKHQVSSLLLKHQESSPSLRQQAWLTTYVKNPKDLTGLICPFERSNRLGLSISSSIVE